MEWHGALGVIGSVDMAEVISLKGSKVLQNEGTEEAGPR